MDSPSRLKSASHSCISTTSAPATYAAQLPAEAGGSCMLRMADRGLRPAGMHSMHSMLLACMHITHTNCRARGKADCAATHPKAGSLLKYERASA